MRRGRTPVFKREKIIISKGDTLNQTLAQIQKLMMEMIREKDIDQGLWETYVRLVEEERVTVG